MKVVSFLCKGLKATQFDLNFYKNIRAKKKKGKRLLYFSEGNSTIFQHKFNLYCVVY